jgi:phosphoribosyl-dephospho-CoA transferase
MTLLQRNQLVWLSASAWQALLARPWDAQAQAILYFWQAEQLPLVVCRQRLPASPQRISLGLPAPLQWERRKLAFELPVDAITRCGAFPLLRSIPLGPADTEQVQALLLHTDALQVAVQVYGSYGWQWLCGLPCVRASSDMDLLLHVADLDMAGQMVWLLQGLHLDCRVDGELVFPGGWAVAWREYAQLIGGKVEQVLVKHRTGVQLLGMAALRSLYGAPALDGLPIASPIAALAASQVASLAATAVGAAHAY